MGATILFHSTIVDTRVYKFDTKVDIVATPSHCSTNPVISGFLSSYLHRLSNFVSVFTTAVHFRVNNGTVCCFLGQAAGSLPPFSF